MVTVTVADHRGSESGLDNGTQAGFYINCSPDCDEDTVTWVLSGTATDGVDYNCDNDSPQAITGGSEALRIRCTVEDDSDIEGTEYITLTLEDDVPVGTDYTVGDPDSQTVEIIDDDSTSYDYGRTRMN